MRRAVIILLGAICIAVFATSCSLHKNAEITIEHSNEPLPEENRQPEVSVMQPAEASFVDLAQQQYGPVHSAWMTTPIPSPVNYVPLFNDLEQDREKIERILSWINLAEKVDEDGLVPPLRGRSMAVNVAFAEGNTLVIRPAWTCETEVGEQGNTSTHCTSVQDRVWISMPDNTEVFAASPELYALATETYRDWMPEARPL